MHYWTIKSLDVSIEDHGCLQLTTNTSQALALAHQVQLPRQLSNTPAIITPPYITPACHDEPGGSPMLDDTSSPMPLTGNTVSNAPFVQKRLAGSMHRNALRNAAARARTVRPEDLVVPSASVI